MKHTLMLPVVVDIKGHDGQKSLPSFYEEAATIDNEASVIRSIGRSATHPFVFYLFSEGERPNSSNSRFAAIVNMTDTIHEILRQFVEIDEKDLALSEKGENT